SVATATAPPEFYVANIFLLQAPAQSQDSSPSADGIDPIFGRLVLQTQGALEDGDQIAFQDGSLYDEYPIEGTSGQHLKISLESSEFDPYLILIGPNGDILARHDDISRDNFNATIDIVLPDNGSYRIIANGYSHYSQGRYTLSIHMTEPLGGEPLVGPAVPDHGNR
ncbi:MAG: PPC domain-containing protein, partial [Elainellaceae cyanobacterium]